MTNETKKNEFIERIALIKMNYSPEEAFCALTELIKDARKFTAEDDDYDAYLESTRAADGYIEAQERDAAAAFGIDQEAK